ncbi:MAG: hypothetical protein J6T01_05035 [Kiritimatiellae bacterium]|nr:hypothetical protein [Kiritimatiellia bacterium]
MHLKPNWIYSVKTAGGRLAVITSVDRPELPAGDAAETNPVYHTVGGFMLGRGESADGNRYRAAITFEQGNHFRNILRWSGPLALSGGRWTLRGGSSARLDHYLAGRRFLSGSVSLKCAAHRAGKVEVFLVAAGGKTRLFEISAPGAAGAKIPEKLLPMNCPSLVIAAGDGCDLDLESYGFEGDFDGPPVAAEAGVTEYRDI